MEKKLKSRIKRGLVGLLAAATISGTFGGNSGGFAPIHNVKEGNSYGICLGLVNQQKEGAKHYGLQIGLGNNPLSENEDLTHYHVGKVYGAQVGLFNGAEKVYGAQVGLINGAEEKVYGAQVGIFNFAEKVYGAEVGLFNGAEKVNGAEVGLFNRSDEVNGAQVGIFNWSDEVYGAEVGLINLSDEVNGAQVGLINDANESINGNDGRISAILNM